MTHVGTSAHYPQSNGQIGRWHQSLKRECIRPRSPLSIADAREIVAGFVGYYNCERLHSAIGFVTPKDKPDGNENRIFSERDRKLEQARENRKRNRLDLENKFSKNSFNGRILSVSNPSMERRWSVTGTESLRNGVQVTLHRSGGYSQKNLFQKQGKSDI